MDQPWLQEKAWRDNHIRSGSRYAHWSLLAFAVVWNGISAPILWQVEDILGRVEQEPVVLVAFLFPLVGAGLIIAAVRMFLAWQKFGPAPLVLDPFPGSIGGHVGGWVDTRIAFNAAQRFDVTLACLKSSVSGSGKDRKRSESVHWQTDGVCQVERSGKGSELFFRFTVPEGLPATDLDKTGTYFLWRLTVACELDGPDFSRSYDIPVFPTAARSTLKVGTETHAATQDRAMEGIESVSEIRPVPGGIEAVFPAWQRPAQGIASGLFGLVFTAIGVGVGFADDGGIMIPVIFTGLGLLVFGFGVWYLGKSLLVGVTAEGVRCRRFLFGYPLTTRRLHRADVQGVEIKENGTMTAGNKTTVYYQVIAKGRDGQKLVVGERLTSRAEAELLKETFDTYLGL